MLAVETDGRSNRIVVDDLKGTVVASISTVKYPGIVVLLNSPGSIDLSEGLYNQVVFIKSYLLDI